MADLGLIALVIAFVVAFVGIGMNLAGAWLKRPALVVAGRNATLRGRRASWPWPA